MEDTITTRVIIDATPPIARKRGRWFGEEGYASTRSKSTVICSRFLFEFIARDGDIIFGALAFSKYRLMAVVREANKFGVAVI